MSSIIIKNKLFFTLCLVFIGFCGLQIILYPKGSLVLWFNSIRTIESDFLFKYITHLGDGLAFVIVSILILLFIKIRWGIICLFTYIASGLLAQFFKKIVFGPLPRPLKYFDGNVDLQGVEGFNNSYIYSFPSGHTTTAFAMFALITILYSGNKTVAIVCFIIAVLTGLSRIYLAQHFTEDVLAGTILGLVCSTFFYFWLEVKQPSFLKKESLNKPLFTF